MYRYTTETPRAKPPPPSSSPPSSLGSWSWGGALFLLAKSTAVDRTETNKLFSFSPDDFLSMVSCNKKNYTFLWMCFWYFFRLLPLGPIVRQLPNLGQGWQNILPVVSNTGVVTLPPLFDTHSKGKETDTYWWKHKPLPQSDAAALIQPHEVKWCGGWWCGDAVVWWLASAMAVNNAMGSGVRLLAALFLVQNIQGRAEFSWNYSFVCIRFSYYIRWCFLRWYMSISRPEVSKYQTKKTHCSTALLCLPFFKRVILGFFMSNL
jgi:hypothetical protein